MGYPVGVAEQMILMVPGYRHEAVGLGPIADFSTRTRRRR